MLAVVRGASPEEVKSAYRRLVRVHRPEDDPDGFARIAEAYRVLSDPELRAAYDASERIDPRIGAALDEAASLAATDARAGVTKALAVSAQAPDSTLVRFAVASICLRAQRPLDALPLVERLVADHPKRADLRAMLGDTFAAAERPADAAREFAAALALDPSSVGACLSLAALHDAQNRADAALRVVDAGILAGSTASIDRLPLHLRKITLLARDGRWPEMQKVAVAIQSSVPQGDADATRHAASRLATLGEQYAEAYVADVARFLVGAAYGIDAHPALKARMEELGPPAARARACRDACADAEVALWLKALLAPHFGRRLSDAEWAQNWRATVALARRKRARCESEWKRLRSTHAAAAAAIEGNWREIAKQSREAAPAPTAESSAATVRVVLAVILAFVLMSAMFGNWTSRPPTHGGTYAETIERLRQADALPGETTDEFLARRYGLRATTKRTRPPAAARPSDAPTPTIPVEETRDAATAPAAPPK